VSAFYGPFSLDSDNESIRLSLSVRHRNSWQETPRVLRDWGELQTELHKFGKRMGVDFDSPPVRRLIYQGGTLKSGRFADYKRSLMKSDNIESYRSLTAGPPAPARHEPDALFLAQLQQSHDGA
jgi:hypothetical protein